ncbi:hypothetical protein PIB30_001935 [Stylosanthes scabra]|uniref:Legume lectin domain-containing protein n=1 Tax=Stylosanthes scabra TaxID=79078 RepID=A0ABU6Y330_9FABA|nr:hypothetical protein [Stylosanthes scabra]
MKPFCGFLVTFFLLLLAASSLAQIDETTTFRFNYFRRGDPLIELQGNARILSSGDVQLADDVASNSGRLLYSRPVRLWNRTTGNVASFMTSFTFTMNDIRGFAAAEGIVFFIAPENIQLTSHEGIGGALGIAQSNGVGLFVGVEFDNFVNGEFRDPGFVHIGIDVNTVISTKTTLWKRVSGTVVQVTVVYDSSSNVLSAIALNGDGEIFTIAQVVDLTVANLPERVKFGFSSSTGTGRQLHTIRSWSFTSTLQSGFRRLTTNNNNGTNIKHATSFAQTDETTTFSFNFFRQGDPLIELQGNARILSNGDAQLADNVASNSGRVLYSRPVRLWNRTTGNVASFMTSFSFTMNNVQGFTPAEGIVFFIAPENIRLTSHDGIGGGLGIAQFNGGGQFVGVEFDNFRNAEFRDPGAAHVGIDVNSVISTKTTPWTRVTGTVVQVTVSYDSYSEILSVVALNGNGVITTIAHVVDLRTANLPERVKFGFSSSTGTGRQLHLIRSWYFTSTLRSGPRRLTTNNNNGTNIEHVPEI